MMLFAMANCGLPATSGRREFMVIMGAMKFNFWIASLPGRLSSSAPPTRCGCYKRVIFGEVANKRSRSFQTPTAREVLVLGLLAIAVLWLACIPLRSPRSCHASVNDLLKHVAASKREEGKAC